MNRLSARGTALLATLVTFGVVCLAQQLSDHAVYSDVESQIRSIYNIPPTVHLSIAAGDRADFSKYDPLVVTFSSGDRSQKAEFLISTDRKTLVEVVKLDLTDNSHNLNALKIQTSGLPVRGNRDARVTIVVYDDFECPFCARMHKELSEDILKAYGDRVKVVYKDFPLTEIHLWAKHAAINAHCLASQNENAYWAFVDAIHGNQSQIELARPLPRQLASLDEIAQNESTQFHLDSASLQTCLEKQPGSEVESSLKEGNAMGVSATPTVFINGRKFEGALTVDELKAVIEESLQ